MRKTVLARIIKNRQTIYSILKRVYERELTPDFISKMRLIIKPIKNVDVISSTEVKNEVKAMLQFVEEITPGNLEDIQLKLAADYARLFLSIHKTPAHPSESVYRDGAMMQAYRDEVLQSYWDFGVDVISEFTEPEDHIATELSFMAFLCEKSLEALKKGKAIEIDRLLQTQADFVNNHLLKWIPDLVKDVVSNAKTSFYKSMAIITEEYIKLDRSIIEDILEHTSPKVELLEQLMSVFESFDTGSNLLKKASSKEIKEAQQEKEFVTSTFGGGVVVSVKNRRVTKTDPLPIPPDVRQYEIKAHGRTFKPPRKCLPDMWGHGYRRWVYDPARVRYPLKRVNWEPGGKGKYHNRGLSEFVRISWDEAAELITGELKRIKETYGNAAITYKDTFHTTWGTIHGMGTEYTIIPRFLNILGGFTEYVIGTSSWVGWVSGASFMYGFWWANSTSEGHDSLADALQNSRMVVYWALDPTKSTRMYHGHEMEPWRHWVREAGIKTVIISPEVNDTAVAHADRWIPIYPGYDAALAAAIMYIWITEGTYDTEYVRTHTVGFEKLADYILGKDDGVPKTPEWAEEVCDVKADIITGLAREWAAGPVTLYCQLGGACRGWYGHEWTRMMVALQTLQGLGKPGVNIVSWGWASGGAPFDKTVRMPGYTTGIKPVETKSYSNPIPQKIHAIDVSDCILRPPVKWRGGTTGATYWGEEFFRNYVHPMPGYSEIKMVMRLGGGQLLSYSNVNWRVSSYLSPKVETIVIDAIFMEPCTWYADIVLPACTDLERNDISMLGCGGLYIPYSGSANHQIAIYHKKCIEPLGQSKSDLEIYYTLAKKLGIFEQLSEGNTEEDWIRKLFYASSICKVMSYEEFKEKGYYVFPFPEKYEPTPALRWFYDEAKGLCTPSGKIELYSQVLADFYGEKNPEIAPVPKFVEPKDGRKSAFGKNYPLSIFVSHPKFRFHTMQENNTWLRKLHKKARKGHEYEPAWISGEDARVRGIKDGDIVTLYNDKGKILAAAHVTERIKPGVVRMFYGSNWLPDDRTAPGVNTLDRGGSANVLTTNAAASAHAHLHRIAHNMVEVRKWGGEN